MKDLQNEIRDFAIARNWEYYHSPEELARALMVEAGELNALFLWDYEWQLRHTPNEIDWDYERIENAYWQRVADELADVFIYTLRLADVLGLDVGKIVRNKMVKNAEKYLAGKANDATT